MQKKIDKIKMMKDKDERNEKEGRDFFLKMRPPDFFPGRPLALSPAKRADFHG